MSFPNDYDTEALQWALAEELVVLTLNGAITDGSDVSMIFNETTEVDNLNVPTYLTFLDEDTNGDFEIVKVTATPGAVGECTVERGALSSTPMPHSDDAQATQDPVSAHFSSIRTLLLGIEKYHGLVGVESALPGTCVAGESFMATDTDKLYYAVDDDVWREINELDHATLDSASLLDDDHNTKPYRYHTDARKLLWHSGDSDYTNTPVGTHISTIAHIHDGTGTEGAPVARFEHGLEIARPATPADGQLFYATDTGDLWVGNSSSWEKYSVMPITTIIMFEGDCPQGWSEVTAMHDKIPRGAPDGVTGGFTDGGSETHDHDMPNIVNHSHTIQSQSGIDLDSGGGHSHSKSNHMWISTNATVTFWNVNMGTYRELWWQHGTHQHSVTFPEHDTNDTGSGTATSDAGTSWSPWVKLVFCEKD